MTKEELVDKIRNIILKYDENPLETLYTTNGYNLWEISYEIAELLNKEK